MVQEEGEMIAYGRRDRGEGTSRAIRSKTEAELWVKAKREEEMRESVGGRGEVHRNEEEDGNGDDGGNDGGRVGKEEKVEKREKGVGLDEDGVGGGGRGGGGGGGERTGAASCIGSGQRWGR